MLALKLNGGKRKSFWFHVPGFWLHQLETKNLKQET